jgi:MYXO-CTERM domain-containing protein
MALQFVAGLNKFPGEGPLVLSLDGTSSPYYEVKTVSLNYDLYEADVSEWAGKTSQLKVTIGAGSDPGFISAVLVSGFTFSSSAVQVAPEPGAWVRALLGLVTLGAIRRRQKP